jgi:hypothetical protein
MRIVINVPADSLPELFCADPTIPGGDRENILGFLHECLRTHQVEKWRQFFTRTKASDDLTPEDAHTKLWIDNEVALGDLMMKNLTLEL